MNINKLRRLVWAFAGGMLLSFSSIVAAEPPMRAARLGYLSGTVSFSPAGESDWVRAAVNRPLTTGDRLWTDSNSRAEVQLGGTAIRMGPTTSMVLLNLDDRIAQVQLSQGTLKIRVRSLGPRQTIEVATPNLAFTLRRPGEYRIEVDPRDDATSVMVKRGEAEVYGEGASYTVNSRRAYRFYGTDLSDYDTLSAQRDDDLDRWSRERDRRGDNSVSARYVSSEVVGYEDLDANGKWRVDPTYGSVWTPTRVAAGWTPYRDGHWSWVDPWGWTWVDDAPWGYAVSHYGRWAHISNTWAWVPGPRRERAVYAPALVAFIGGENFQISVSVGGTGAPHVGWFPLAPREVYQPTYPVSRTYFDSVNRSNAVIAPTAITKVYNTTIVNNTTNITNVVYVNQRVTGAVVAVPTQTFVQSQPVAKAAVHLKRDVLVKAPVMRVASVAPVQNSVQGGASEAATKPPQREHAIVARTAPPPAPLPFAAQQAQLAARPGSPIDAAQRTHIKPAAPLVAAPKVSVVAAAPEPAATALPPAKAPGGKSPQARKAEAPKAPGRNGEGRRPDTEKAAGASADAVGTEAAKSSLANAEALKAEAARTAAAQAAAAKVKADAAKADAAKADADAARASNAKAKAESAKADAASAKADVSKADAAKAKADASKADAAQAEAARADAAKAAKTKAESAKADADAAQASNAKADSAKADAAKAKADASKADAAQAKAARADAAKAAKAKADSVKADADAARASNAKAESAKADADAARASNAKAESAKADAARAKADASKADAAQAEAARADAAKAAKTKVESAKADAAKAKADASKADAAQAEAARADAAKDAKTKAESAKADAARARQAKAEAAHAVAARKPPGATAMPPESHASAPRTDADANAKDEKTKNRGQKP